jgi:hypothetical protein
MPKTPIEIMESAYEKAPITPLIALSSVLPTEYIEELRPRSSFRPPNTCDKGDDPIRPQKQFLSSVDMTSGSPLA